MGGVGENKVPNGYVLIAMHHVAFAFFLYRTLLKMPPLIHKSPFVSSRPKWRDLADEDLQGCTGEIPRFRFAPLR